MATFLQQAAAVRRRMAGDRHRPKVHFLAPHNWLNDPNGLIQLGRDVHMFYQHNPQSAWWGTPIWGHAVSRDLIHWKDQPPALLPDRPYDARGCFTGCAVDDGGVPTAIYTGNGFDPAGRPAQSQCVATSDRRMIRWRKHASNPVIASAPAGFSSRDFRDPYVWRQGRRWHMAVGGTRGGRRGVVLHYTSGDLADWRYEGVLFSGGARQTGRMFECPNFFRLGRKWVLIGSPIPLGRAVYFTGTFAAGHFTAEVQGEVDAGGCLYAPQAFADAAGRRVLFGWLRERRSRRAAARAGWAGVMSLPRVLTVGADGRLNCAPAHEVECLRRRHEDCGPLELGPDELLAEPALGGEAKEIAAEFVPAGARRFGLAVRRSRRGAEETLIVYDRRARTLAIDTTRSSRSRAAQKDVRTAPLKLAGGQPLSLRVFVDASVIEVYANGRTCLTGRVYPTAAGATGAAVFAEGGPVTLRRLEAWDLRL